MSADPNKKTARTFHCRDALWDVFEQMARELECSVDYLINEAMKQYARQRNQSGPYAAPRDAGSDRAQPGSVPLAAPPTSLAPAFGALPPPPPARGPATLSARPVSNAPPTGQVPLPVPPPPPAARGPVDLSRNPIRSASWALAASANPARGTSVGVLPTSVSSRARKQRIPGAARPDLYAHVDL